MRLQFLGCGDAFGSGGRFNTCFHVTGARTNLLIDCGASSLIAMKKFAIDRNAIDTILVTHFHADHFGGLPFLMLDAQFYSKRARPLTIAGPPGLPDWFARARETSFPGSSAVKPRFELILRELKQRERVEIGGIAVTPYPVSHGNEGGPFFAYRVEAEGKTICYSGDTEWAETLIEAAGGADLFVCECYFFDKPVKLHLDLKTLQQHLPRIAAKRVILTHMSDDMLSRLRDVTYETAEDGKVVTI